MKQVSYLYKKYLVFILLQSYSKTLQLNILFAQVLLPEISDNIDLSNNELLKNMNDYCIKSLSGLRNTEEILKLTPNKKQFRITLKAIKLWAKSLFFIWFLIKRN